MGEIPITCFVLAGPEHIEVYGPGSQLHLEIILATLEQCLWQALCWKWDSPHWASQWVINKRLKEFLVASFFTLIFLNSNSNTKSLGCGTPPKALLKVHLGGEKKVISGKETNMSFHPCLYKAPTGEWLSALKTHTSPACLQFCTLRHVCRAQR